MNHEHQMWVEVPIRVFFSSHKEEKGNRDYPGSPAGVEIDDVSMDFEDTGAKDILEYIGIKFKETIVEECLEVVQTEEVEKDYG